MSRKPQTPFRVLAVAGLDPCGGAGIAADLRTIAALGGHGAAAVTAITVQDSREVRAVAPVAAALVRAQVEAVLGDAGADAVKIGMLGSAPVARAVAAALAAAGGRRPPVVLDPVLRATSGRDLLDRGGREQLVGRLLPLADLVTPNLPEAAALLGRPIPGARGMEAAARALLALGARAVLLKGGHLRGDAVDLLARAGEVVELRAPRVAARHTHGSGCVLASAIACHLAMGRGLPEAARRGKRFVTAAIRAGYPLGAGRGPVDPTAAGRRLAGRGAA